MNISPPPNQGTGSSEEINNIHPTANAASAAASATVADTTVAVNNNTSNLYAPNVGPGSESWPDDADYILENIRCNSIILSDYHKSQYFFLLSRLKYFRIPIIIISAFASVFNIGLQPFMDQGYISVLCCMLSLVTGLIGSIELFLQVQKKMENELMNSRDFYLNAIDIYKVLSLEPKHRNGDGLKYLDGKFAMYCKMIENSNVLDKSIQDQLAPIDIGMIERISAGTAPKPGEESKNTMYKNISTNNMEHMKNITTPSCIDSFFTYFFHTSFPKHYYNPENVVNNHRTSSLSTTTLVSSGKNHRRNHHTDELDSVNTEDRFDIYCTLLQHAEKIDQEMIRKITHILSNSRHTAPHYDLSLEERMKIYSYFMENIDVLGGESELLDKIKLLLVGDFFHKKKIYETPHHHTSFAVLDKINTILNQDIESGNNHDVSLGSIGELHPLSEISKNNLVSNKMFVSGVI
jgi:hypothetical protein